VKTRTGLNRIYAQPVLWGGVIVKTERSCVHLLLVVFWNEGTIGLQAIPGIIFCVFYLSSQINLVINIYKSTYLNYLQGGNDL